MTRRGNLWYNIGRSEVVAFLVFERKKVLQRILVKIATGCVLRVFRCLTVLIVYICPVLDDGLFVLVAAGCVVFFIYEVIGHILLGDPAERIVVRV